MQTSTPQRTHVYSPGPSIPELSRALAQNLEYHANAIMNATGVREGHTLRYGTNQGLSIFLDGTKRGRWVDFSSAGSKGDMVDLIAYRHQCTLAEAAHIAHDMLGGGAIEHPPAPVHDPAAEAAARAQKIMKAQHMWGRLSTTPYASARAYLEHRKLTPIDGMRYGRVNPELAMRWFKMTTQQVAQGPIESVAVPLTDETGAITAIHQVWTQNGRKIPIKCAKRTFGCPIGSAWRIGRPRKLAVLCEGPETGLAIHQATGLYVLSATGTDLLYQVQCAQDIRKVVVAIDDGTPGITAGNMAVEHLKNNGILARCTPPPSIPGMKKSDFWDIFDHGGPAAVHALLMRLPAS